MVVLALTGDMHVNSTVALSADRLTLDDGGEYRPSRPQKWINKKWAEYWSEVRRLKKQHDCEVVTILNGELADDLRHPSTQLISRNNKDLVNHSLKVLEPVQQITDRLYATRGSEAHSGLSGSIDESIARAIGAIPDENGHYARWYFRGVIDGLRVDAAHHPGTGHMRPWTKGADANRLAAMIMYRYLEQEQPVPHLVVRGHNHKPSDSGTNHPTRAVITPSWQMTNAFGHRLGGGWLPIGGMIAVIDKGEIIFERQMYSRWPIGSWRQA